MTKLLSACLAAFFVTGCASSVKLNDVPVEDRQATAVAPGSGGADGTAAGQVPGRGVEGVALDNAGAAAEAEKKRLAASISPVVYFDYDSFAVKSQFQKAIEAYAGQLKGDARRRVQVEGHTDELGGREYNVALGQKRADAVRKALVDAGALASQIETVSYGKEKPAASGSDEESRSRNRRAVINY
ncbi:MAG: OmpA family protein [Pseudomonadota bacterium]